MTGGFNLLRFSGYSGDFWGLLQGSVLTSEYLVNAATYQMEASNTSKKHFPWSDMLSTLEHPSKQQPLPPMCVPRLMTCGFIMIHL